MAMNLLYAGLLVVIISGHMPFPHFPTFLPAIFRWKQKDEKASQLQISNNVSQYGIEIVHPLVVEDT